MNNRQKLGYMVLGASFLIVIGVGLFLGCAKKEQPERIFTGIDWRQAVDEGEEGNESRVVSDESRELRIKRQPVRRPVPRYSSYMKDVKGNWKGYLTASESLRWLKDNGCEVQKNSDGIGYTITRDNYNPITGVRDGLHVRVTSTGLLVVGDVALTLDNKGDLRVKVLTAD